MAEGFPERRDITRTQWEKVRALLAAILPTNRFHAAKLEGLGPGNLVSLEQFCEQVPFTTKAELVGDQLAHPPYGTNLSLPLEHYIRCHQTSGTGGTPLRWLDTPESWEWMLGGWTRVFQAAGVTAADRVFFAFSFGPFIGFWLAFEAATRLGCLCLPGGGLSSRARIQAMLDHGATALCCTPTYALRLAEVAAEEKIDLAASRIRRILVAGEPGGSIPSTRSRIERLWPGAIVRDHHGMTESGPVSYECPACPGVLHIMETSFFAEVIDPVGARTMPPGMAGELVLTTLGRTSSPLVRYRTGDLVKPALEVPCQCGSSEMALEGGILGRTDDMVVVRGVNIFPSAVEEVIRACGGVAEYRANVHTVRALTELSFQVEPEPGCADGGALVRRLEKAFQSAFGLRVEVTPVASGSLPRFEMKASRWARH